MEKNRIYYRELTGDAAVAAMKSDFIEIGKFLTNTQNQLNFPKCEIIEPNRTITITNGNTQETAPANGGGNTLLSVREGWTALMEYRIYLDTVHESYFEMAIVRRDSYISTYVFIFNGTIYEKRLPSAQVDSTAWYIGITKYGVILSPPSCDDYSRDTRTLCCFLTYAQDISNSESKAPCVVMWRGGNGNTDQSSYNDEWRSFYIATPLYENVETTLNISTFYLNPDYMAPVPVLVPFVSKVGYYFTPHLYIKETNSVGCYGHIRLEDTYFLAGNTFCLETGERREPVEGGE